MISDIACFKPNGACTILHDWHMTDEYNLGYRIQA
jgi:hypothetical protein